MRIGFIIKSKINGETIFNHLLPSEFHLVKRILLDSDDGQCEIKRTQFTNENAFIFQKF